MKQRLFIIGAGGMLGRELLTAAAACDADVQLTAGSSELDITDAGAVHEVIGHMKPTVVINAAAYTDVDGAEAEPDKALQVNGEGPGHLGDACRAIDALLVHYSTDYVFNGRGQSPYRTNAPTEPLGRYGRSKFAGERAIAISGCRSIIARTSWLFAPHSRNFVTTITRLARERDMLSVVNDQIGRPTLCADLAEMTMRLIDHQADAGSRIVHACNDGSCSWFDLASAAIELAGIHCKLEPCTTEAFPRPAPRPPYSVLDLTELKDAIGDPPHWRDALQRCIDRMTSQRERACRMEDSQS